MAKRFITIGMLIFALAIASGCGLLSKGKEKVGSALSDTEEKQEGEAEQEEAEEVSTELGDYNVAFDGEVKEEDDQFIIDGQSNLLPGSRIVGEVVVDEGETIFSDTSELIEDDGTFHMELEHHKYGEAEIFIRFDFDNVQDDEINRHYGEKGQKLEGPFIYRHKTYDGILNKAEVRLDYEADGENDLAIKAPEWMEIPEDYGDPRVWMEVDELTEDGEFFYLHGHSNLLEGSEIKVEYQYNNDTTQVNPDGSFDFKFDYEYIEDKDIVITFTPSHYQWNEIEEAYGKNGQNLVGNLVKTNKYSTDKQYVEKTIEWDNEKSEMESDNGDVESDAADEDAKEDKDDKADKADKDKKDDKASKKDQEDED